MNNHFTTLALLLNDLTGQEGNIIFNTCMFEHNHSLNRKVNEKRRDELDEYQFVILGEKDKPIDKHDIKAFLENVQKVLDDPIFKNGRTYEFEGIGQNDEDDCYSYYIMWGS